MKTFKELLQKADKQGINLPDESWVELMGLNVNSKVNMCEDDFQHYVDNAVFELRALEEEAALEFRFQEKGAQVPFSFFSAW